MRKENLKRKGKDDADPVCENVTESESSSLDENDTNGNQAASNDDAAENGGEPKKPKISSKKGIKAAKIKVDDDSADNNSEDDENDDQKSSKPLKKVKASSEDEKSEQKGIIETDNDESPKGKKSKIAPKKGKVAKKKQTNGDAEEDPLSSENTKQQESDVEKPNKTKKGAAKKGKAEKKGKKKPKVEEDEEEKEEKEEEYEVEDIVDHKIVKGKTHYRIRWKNYDEESDTWEPESTLSCPEIIKKYKNSMDTKKTAKGKATKRGKKVEEEVDPEAEWEVQGILDVRTKKDKKEFLVRWKGYSTDEATWEPEENLNCVDMIDKFVLKMEKDKNIEDKSLRVSRKSTSLYNSVEGRKVSQRNSNKKRVNYVEDE